MTDADGPTSRSTKSMAELRLDLIWGAWAELGVAGWPSTHGNWAIDPEPLILHTARVGDDDPRLRDEATDWCIKCWRYVSRIRLRNLLREEDPELQARFGEFAATVNAHARVNWPGATRARPYRPTGRSALPSLDHPALVPLRLRAMFGLGARTEILRHFLSNQGGYSVATLAASTGYAKRNVAEECESLERAGVLAIRQIANRFYYSLGRRSELAAFVGDQPSIWPPWSSLLRVVDTCVDLELAAQTTPDRVMAAEARKALDAIEEQLDNLRIEGPDQPAKGSSLWPPMETWGKDLMARWAKGRWPTATNTEPAASEIAVRRIARRS